MVSSEIIKDDFAIIGGRGDEDREKKSMINKFGGFGEIARFC
jgi:hypothetical protein